jgi:hypothetical protein
MSFFIDDEAIHIIHLLLMLTNILRKQSVEAYTSKSHTLSLSRWPLTPEQAMMRRSLLTSDSVWWCHFTIGSDGAERAGLKQGSLSISAILFQNS